VLRALALVRIVCPFLVPVVAMSGVGIGSVWLLVVLLDCAMAERLTASASPVAGSHSPPWMRLAVYPLCLASLALLLTVQFPVRGLPLGLLGSMLGWFGCLAIGALAMWHRLRALGFEERRAGLGGA
jgi:hypothetical protein